MKLLKILFFGSSSYCLPVLERLHSEKNITAVVTKPNGKIAEFTKEKNIKTFLVINKTELEAVHGKLKDLNSDIAIVSDFGLIIPEIIFSLPKNGTLNIHFSNLPKLRGASPVQHTILQNQKKAGITVLKMDAGLDTGDIVWQKEYPLEGNETAGPLYTRLFKIVAEELPQIIIEYISGKITLKKQDPSKATYTRILTRQDGYIPLEQLLDKKYSMENYRKFRAFFPWPGIWSIIEINGKKKRVKILDAHLQPATYPTSAGPRKRRDNLQPDIVQLEGKNPVTWKQFRQGYKITP